LIGFARGEKKEKGSPPFDFCDFSDTRTARNYRGIVADYCEGFSERVPSLYRGIFGTCSEFWIFKRGDIPRLILINFITKVLLFAYF